VTVVARCAESPLPQGCDQCFPLPYRMAVVVPSARAKAGGDSAKVMVSWDSSRTPFGESLGLNRKMELVVDRLIVLRQPHDHRE
jgi:hypothetical protein